MTMSIARRCAAAAVLISGCVGTSSAQAGSCSYGHCWGAVAAGPLGMAARVTRMRTAQEAEQRVARICTGRCEIVEVFVDGCGVIVEDSFNTTWAEFGSSRDQAMARAEALCEAQGQGRCRVRVWACTD